MSRLSADRFFDYVPNDMYLQAGAAGATQDDDLPTDPANIGLCECWHNLGTCCCSVFVPCVVADAIGKKVLKGKNTQRYSVDVLTVAEPAAEATSVVWCACCCMQATQQAMAAYSTATPILSVVNSLAVCFLGHRTNRYLSEQKQVPKESLFWVGFQSFFCAPCYLTKLNVQTSTKPVKCPCC